MPVTNTIHVLCSSERTEPADVYPEGINGAIATYFCKLPDLAVQTALIDYPDQVISQSTLGPTDVLIRWTHRA